MKSYKSTILYLSALLLGYSFMTRCSGAKQPDIVSDKTANVVDYKEEFHKTYNKYRFISNKELTFDPRDEISEDHQSDRRRYYIVAYNRKKQIVTVKTYVNQVISEKWLINPMLGSIMRKEQYRNGKLFEYQHNSYDPEEKGVITKREVFNENNQIKRIENFLFGDLEDIDYYDSAQNKTKKEIYAGRKVDLIQYFNDKGLLTKETGTYDNGQYPYALNYYYNDKNKLYKVGYLQKNKLTSNLYYNDAEVISKEEKFNSFGNIYDTIFYDNDGNPIENFIDKK